MYSFMLSIDVTAAKCSDIVFICDESSAKLGYFSVGHGIYKGMSPTPFTLLYFGFLNKPIHCVFGVALKKSFVTQIK